ncbi:MAG: hypothetical protein ACLFRX_03210 [Gemmatimonadota bacterium]
MAARPPLSLSRRKYTHSVALWVELERMSEQRRESRDYGKTLRGTVAGFGRG